MLSRRSPTLDRLGAKLGIAEPVDLEIVVWEGRTSARKTDVLRSWFVPREETAIRASAKAGTAMVSLGAAVVVSVALSPSAEAARGIPIAPETVHRMEPSPEPATPLVHTSKEVPLRMLDPEAVRKAKEQGSGGGSAEEPSPRLSRAAVGIKSTVFGGLNAPGLGASSTPIQPSLAVRPPTRPDPSGGAAISRR